MEISSRGRRHPSPPIVLGIERRVGRSVTRLCGSDGARQGCPPFRRRCATLTGAIRSRGASIYRASGSRTRVKPDQDLDVRMMLGLDGDFTAASTAGAVRGSGPFSGVRTSRLQATLTAGSSMRDRPRRCSSPSRSPTSRDPRCGTRSDSVDRACATAHCGPCSRASRCMTAGTV